MLLFYAAAGGGIIATVTHLLHSADHAFREETVSSRDALRRELERCVTLGLDAPNDPRCQAAWAENRRRFFDGVSPHDSDPAILGRVP